MKPEIPKYFIGYVVADRHFESREEADNYSNERFLKEVFQELVICNSDNQVKVYFDSFKRRLVENSAFRAGIIDLCNLAYREKETLDAESARIQAAHQKEVEDTLFPEENNEIPL